MTETTTKDYFLEVVNGGINKDDEKPELGQSLEEDTTEESDEATTIIPNDFSNEDDSLEDTTEVLVSNDIDEELETSSEVETSTDLMLEEDNSEEEVDDIDSVTTTTEIPEAEITTIITPMGVENENDKEVLVAGTEKVKRAKWPKGLKLDPFIKLYKN